VFTLREADPYHDLVGFDRDVTLSEEGVRWLLEEGKFPQDDGHEGVLAGSGSDVAEIFPVDVVQI
jgi:hypothetical protein